MAALILAEAGEAVTGSATRAAVAAMQGLGPLHLLVCGASDAAARAARIAGVSRVLHCADPACAAGLAEPLAALLATLADGYDHVVAPGSAGYDHVVAPASAQGSNVMPRLAALLDVQIVPRVLRVIDAVTFLRPTYAGNALATVRSDQPRQVLTIDILATEPVPATGGTAEVIAVAAPACSFGSERLGFAAHVSARPDLGTARIVVSGGRGLPGPETVAALEAVADRLGAAVGASLAAVDAGLFPPELQVGQSGRTIAPELYIAAGISGAVQHLAGMQGAKVVVAINLDPEAPILAACDYALEGDAAILLPALADALGSG